MQGHLSSTSHREQRPGHHRGSSRQADTRHGVQGKCPALRGFVMSPDCGQRPRPMSPHHLARHLGHRKRGGGSVSPQPRACPAPAPRSLWQPSLALVNRQLPASRGRPSTRMDGSFLKLLPRAGPAVLSQGERDSVALPLEPAVPQGRTGRARRAAARAPVGDRGCRSSGGPPGPGWGARDTIYHLSAEPRNNEQSWDPAWRAACAGQRVAGAGTGLPPADCVPQKPRAGI